MECSSSSDPDVMTPRLPYSGRIFDPTPEDLIGYFLRNHILKKPYPESGIIQEETVYDEDLNPWEKFCNKRDPYPWEYADSSTPTLFLFTKLSDVGVTDKSSRIQKNRRAGCGAWHATDKVKAIKSFEDERVVIGHQRTLNFRLNNGQETEGQWNMYEFTISAQAFPEIQEVKGWNNQVVCMIKRNDSKANTRGRLFLDLRVEQIKVACYDIEINGRPADMCFYNCFTGSIGFAASLYDLQFSAFGYLCYIDFL